MKKYLFLTLVFISSYGIFAQDDCFKKLEDAFKKRGSFSVADDMHRNVIVSFFEGTSSNCVAGKARVENGTVVSIFLQYKDDTYELFDKKFYNEKKLAPKIENGISEMIHTVEGEKLRIIFIDKLKPKAKSYKGVTLPDDL
jgi:hypothetical protein